MYGIAIFVLLPPHSLIFRLSQLGISHVMGWGDYIAKFCPESSALNEIFVSISATRTEGALGRDKEHNLLDEEAVLAAVKERRLLRGVLHVGRYNPRNAYINNLDGHSGEGMERIEDVFIPEGLRSTAMHGDVVAAK